MAPEPEFLYESDELLLVRTRIEIVGSGSEVPLDQVFFHVIRFRDGKITVIRAFRDQQAALEAAGLRE